MSATRPMLEPEAYVLLAEYGVPVVQHCYVRDEESAAKAAESIGYPVVVKVVSRDILHKSDVGGVRVGLTGSDAVRRAFQDMRDLCYRQSASCDGMLVAKQVPAGQEVIIGAFRDVEFGPVVMFGMGGVLVELTKDVAFCLTPVTKEDAKEALTRTMAGKIMTGIRGKAPGDVEAVADCMCHVSKLMEEHPDIEEIDLNPVMVLRSGCVALDARIIETGRKEGISRCELE